MLVALLLSLAAQGTRELDAAMRASALLRFVARIEETESGEVARREQVERRAAADAIERELQISLPAEADGARRLIGAVAAGRREEVAWLAGRLQQSVEREFGWEAVPRQWPSLGRGGRLDMQSCAACHGADGRPSAENPLQLSTPASSFVDPEPADGLSPRRVFDAITSGIPESPMPSFDAAFSDQDRWSIAFYVQALRHARPA